MPPDKGLILWGDKDNRRIVITDEEDNPIRIETMTGLTLDQEQDPDPVWEKFRENMQFTITVDDIDPAWYMRMAYLFGKRRQRKTALEKRKRESKLKV